MCCDNCLDLSHCRWPQITRSHGMWSCTELTLLRGNLGWCWMKFPQAHHQSYKPSVDLQNSCHPMIRKTGKLWILSPSDRYLKYLCHIGFVVAVVVFSLTTGKPLPEPMMIYDQVDFHSLKSNWDKMQFSKITQKTFFNKTQLRNVGCKFGHFFQGLTLTVRGPS